MRRMPREAGEEACVVTTPRRTHFVLLFALLILLAACGRTNGGGNGGGGGSDLPTSATATSEDPEGTTHELAAGRYRVSITAPGCVRPVVSVKTVDGAFTYEQPISTFNAFINNMIDGEYEVAITSDCDEWTIQLDEF
jgi:hypothetical protein